MSIVQLTLTVPPYMVAGSNDTRRGGGPTTTFGATADLTITGDSNGSSLYASHDQVATMLTQLGLMPQLMNIKLRRQSACPASRPTCRTPSRPISGPSRPRRRWPPRRRRSPWEVGSDDKLRGRELYIIVGVVAVVVGVLWFFFLYSPEHKKVATLNTQYVAQQSTLEQTQVQIRQLALLKKTAPQAEADLIKLHQVVPSEAPSRRSSWR